MVKVSNLSPYICLDDNFFYNLSRGYIKADPLRRTQEAERGYDVLENRAYLMTADMFSYKHIMMV